MNKLNKKGEGWLPWLWRMMMVALIITAFVYVKLNIRNNFIKTDDLVFYVLSQRLLVSPNCFIADEPAFGKGILAVVDSEKFTQERLDPCFSNENAKATAKNSLKVDHA